MIHFYFRSTVLIFFGTIVEPGAYLENRVKKNSFSTEYF